MKTIIVGIGNPILGDDGVGIHVLKEVQRKISDTKNVFFEEAMTGGMNLLDIIIGFEKAILIDAVHLKNERNGSVKRMKLKIQMDMYTKYHQTDPEIFYREEDIWDFEVYSQTRR